MLRRAGVVASTTVLVVQLPGQQPRSAVLASAANPWPGAGSLLGKLRHRWGKPLFSWRERGWDVGIPDPAAALCCSAPPPREVAGGQARGSGGGTLPWGPRCFGRGSAAPGAAGAALARGGLGGRSRLASLEPAQSRGERGGERTAPCWGSEKNPLPPLPPPAGATTLVGQGESGEEAAASWARCRLQRRPREPERNEVAPVQVPTAAPVQKIHPELVAVATAMGWVPCRGKGRGAQPQTQVCQHGTLAQGGGSTVGRWSWALAGTKGSCPGSRCPRLPLMFRDFALGKAGRFPRSSRLEPNIQHPGVLA